MKIPVVHWLPGPAYLKRSASLTIGMSDLSVFITSSLTSSERKISGQWELEYFKQRLEQITGIPPVNQQILVYPSTSSAEYQELVGNNERLEKFSALKPFVRVHVEDSREDSELRSIEKGELDDESRFQLSEEAYDQRSGTVRKWKQAQKLGRYNPEESKKRQQEMQENRLKAGGIKLGDRCEIDGDRRGTVKFVGEVKEIENLAGFVWIGVALDEPLGKNDGSIKGHRYFECGKNYGAFVKPNNIQVGDFQAEEYEEYEL